MQSACICSICPPNHLQAQTLRAEATAQAAQVRTAVWLGCDRTHIFGLSHRHGIHHPTRALWLSGGALAVQVLDAQLSPWHISRYAQLCTAMGWATPLLRHPAPNARQPRTAQIASLQTQLASSSQAAAAVRLLSRPFPRPTFLLARLAPPACPPYTLLFLPFPSLLHAFLPLLHASPHRLPRFACVTLTSHHPARAQATSSAPPATAAEFAVLRVDVARLSTGLLALQGQVRAALAQVWKWLGKCLKLVVK